jgi:hypothetical protein
VTGAYPSSDVCGLAVDAGEYEKAVALVDVLRSKCVKTS